MRVILFGATGMVGQGVLREALADPGVEAVLCVGRAPTGQSHPKLTELIHRDFMDFSAVEGALTGYDACFYCLGITSAGLSEEEYRRVTVHYTVAAAAPLARLNPQMAFVFVSGTGTDGTERGSVMWARVKGEAENAVLRLPFRVVCCFRPAFIQPVHGERSRTAAYRALYVATGWLLPLLRWVVPRYVTTTEEVGLAMLHVARAGAPQPVLENWDISALAHQR